nr:reverse transcriptase domain-containing protein [Tanacetum cinerariifolium]
MEDRCEKFLIPRNHVKHRSDDHDGDDPTFVSIISNKSHKSVLRLLENFVGLPGIDHAPVVDASIVKEVVTPAVVDMIVEKEKRSSLNDTTVLGSFPLLPTQGNALGKSSYANSIRAISERFANTTYGFFMGKRVAYHVVANYTLKKSSQTSRGVPVSLKIGFKPQKEYRPVFKKPTANSSGDKKKGVTPTIKVSNSNPFEFLNSVDNDVELGTNGGTTYLVNNEATSKLLTSEKTTLVDEVGNPLKKVEYPDDYDNEDEVASIDNGMAHFMASERDLHQEL